MYTTSFIAVNTTFSWKNLQAQLQEQYKAELRENFGFFFRQLFADYLLRCQEVQDFLELLVDNFNPDTLDCLMCRDTMDACTTAIVKQAAKRLRRDCTAAAAVFWKTSSRPPTERICRKPTLSSSLAVFESSRTL